MPIPRNIFREPAYPGEYTPNHQILQALSEGLLDNCNSSVEPSVAVTESDSNYKIEFTAPGIKRDELLVTINDKGNLCILSMNYPGDRLSGSRLKNRMKSMDILQKEISLPEYVDTGFTSATCHAGTLTIFFTKSDFPVKKRPSTIVVY